MDGLNDHDLQRLVDGELSDDDRRTVLRTCSETPDGWRRCALAFLEAQLFEEALRQDSYLVGASSSIDYPSVLPSVGNQPAAMTGLGSSATFAGYPRRSNRWIWFASMAATALVAFGLGRELPVKRGASPNGAGPLSETLAAVSGTRDASLRDGSVADGTGPSDPQKAVDLSGLITFVGQGDKSRMMPMLRSQPEVADELGELERLLSDKEVDCKRQSGWIPVQLQDGRQALVPVQRLEVRPQIDTTW
jgi:hypothetical protein